MSTSAWLQVLFLIALLAISTPLLGSYLAKVYGGEDSSKFVNGVLGRIALKRAEPADQES